MADSDDAMYVPDVVPAEDRAFYENQERYGNRVGWGDQPALVIVDMTRAFVDDVDETGADTVAATERLLDSAREAGIPVVHTRPQPGETFMDGYPVTTKASPASSRGPDPGHDEERLEWVSKLDEIVPALEPQDGEPVIGKSRASAFFDTHLGNLLRYESVDTLIVAGMNTSGCIRSTVVDSHSSNFRTIVPQECVADPSGISHEVSLFDMDMKYADVTPLPDVLDRLADYA